MTQSGLKKNGERSSECRSLSEQTAAPLLVLSLRIFFSLYTVFLFLCCSSRAPIRHCEKRLLLRKAAVQNTLNYVLP